MVDFGTDYWHAMDKDKVEKITISPKEMGIALGIGDPWANIQTAIKAGASHVELGFMGAGKGSISQPTGVTPEAIGKEKREDIRQLSKLNDVTLSTHATVAASGFAGLGERGFTDEAAARNIREVKRAVDFAADTAGGGPVVIHTGEFTRPIVEAEKKGERPLFEAYEKEEEKGMIPLVNIETGEILGGISKSTKIPEPELDEKGQPKFNEKGEMIFKEAHDFKEFIKEHKKEIETRGIPPEEFFYQQLVDKKRKQAKAELGRWRENMERAQRRKEAIEERQRELYEKERKKPGLGHAKAIEEIEKMEMEPKEGTPEYDKYLKDPIKHLDKEKEKVQHEINYAQSGVEGHGRELEELKEQGKKVKTMTDYAVNRTAQNIAKLGLYAYEVEKKQKLKKPLVIAPENVFAEQYGSHPQELRHIVIKARKAMAEKLKKDYGKKEADKIAADRIKATFDIGHANTWKKYFKEEDPTGKKFKKWLLGEVKQLQKEGIIGNIHLTDNFGFEDEHLTPGQGNAPIEEFLEEIKKEGYKGKFVVEPGAQTEQEGGIFTALTGAWGYLAKSPIYRTAGGAAQSWSDVSGGYLSQLGTTRYVQGTYLPSKESWGWYTETQME